MNHFPFIKQPDAMDCGPACLTMIAMHYGRRYKLERLRKRCFIGRDEEHARYRIGGNGCNQWKTTGSSNRLLPLINSIHTARAMCSKGKSSSQTCPL